MIVLVAFLLGVALGASAGEQNNGVQPMQIVIPILTLLLGVAFSVFLRRPRLQLTGSSSGGGPGPGHHSNRLRVTNQPGLLGIKLKQTVVMGKRIYRDFEKGLTVIRDPAIECRATIHDADDGNRHIAMLWWRPLSDPHADWERTVTIQSGETFELALFARLDNEPTKYFIFEPQSEHSPSPKVPSDDVKFDDTRRFLIRIMYSYGRQELIFRGTMRKGYDGRLRWESEMGGASF